MSFQAYIDTIKTKTGKTPADFKALAEKKGFLNPGTKAGEIVTWLKQDFDLGHGHAMAIYATLKESDKNSQGDEDALGKHFLGEKEKWRSVFTALLKKVETQGKDVTLQPVASYISLLRGGKKFAMVQVTKDRLTIGIKLKNQLPTARFEAAGNWNTMMTHRTSVISSAELDKELYGWLLKAYDQTGIK